jgi:hypothetical protein
MLRTTLAAGAQDTNLPNIDLKKSCDLRAKASADTMGDKSTTPAFDKCMKDEQEARDALLAAWNYIPSSYKGSCIDPSVFAPSYTEWISCLEMNIDFKRLRAKP